MQASPLTYKDRDRASFDNVILGALHLQGTTNPPKSFWGKIHDGSDCIPACLNKSDDFWNAGGFLSLTNREVAGIDLQPIGEKTLYTLNGQIVESLERPPKGGDLIQAETCQ